MKQSLTSASSPPENPHTHTHISSHPPRCQSCLVHLLCFPLDKPHAESRTGSALSTAPGPGCASANTQSSTADAAESDLKWWFHSLPIPGALWSRRQRTAAGGGLLVFCFLEINKDGVLLYQQRPGPMLSGFSSNNIPSKNRKLVLMTSLLPPQVPSKLEGTSSKWRD